jgi:hypothetical protein
MACGYERLSWNLLAVLVYHSQFSFLPDEPVQKLMGAFFAVWEFAPQIPKPQKTGLSAPSPRICQCKSCGLSATIPCAAPAAKRKQACHALFARTPLFIIELFGNLSFRTA